MNDKLEELLKAISEGGELTAEQKAWAASQGISLDGMADFAKKFEGKSPLKLYLEDGVTPNIYAINDLLKNPRYAGWRNQNPGAVSAAKRAKIGSIAEKASAIGLDAAKLAYGVEQVSKAKKIDTRLGAFPAPQKKSSALQRYLAQQQASAESGISSQQYDIERQQQGRDIDAILERAKASSEGQPGMYASSLQGIMNKAQQGAAGRLEATNSARMSARNAMAGALGTEGLEASRIQQSRENAFTQRTAPEAEFNRNRAAAMENAGVRNMFGATSDLQSDLLDLYAVFRGDMPGVIRPTGAANKDGARTGLAGVSDNPASGINNEAMMNFLKQLPLMGDVTHGRLPRRR